MRGGGFLSEFKVHPGNIMASFYQRTIIMSLFITHRGVVEGGCGGRWVSQGEWERKALECPSIRHQTQTATKAPPP